jgi:hypothetical protein
VVVVQLVVVVQPLVEQVPLVVPEAQQQLEPVLVLD